MRVAITTHFPKDPSAPRGGVEAVSVSLVKGLTRFDDLEVHVVTLDIETKRASESAWEGATIHRLPGEKGSALLRAIKTERRLVSEHLMESAPDLVHAHDTYGLMVRGLKIPRVFTIHGFIYGDTLVSGKKWPWLRSKIWKWFETRAWADQPHIISISPYVRERLAGISTGVIHDIDNPISEAFFEIERRERRGVIFSAAVISPRKNTLSLVDAFGQVLKECPFAELRLAGSVVEPRYGQLVEDRIKRYGIKDRVAILGRIGTDEIKRELAQASVFALVSLEENSPMGIEEAMAAGVPVVTSNRCGMPYMVRHGETGYLVNPLSLKEVALRLTQLLEDDPHRQKMGEKGKAVAHERFHPEAVARRTREVYYQVLDRTASKDRT
jgi:glycosyltransferase involved in cell wall biosynthesis